MGCVFCDIPMSNFQWNNHKPTPASNLWAVSSVTFPCQIFSETIMSLPLHPIPRLCPLWHSHVKFPVKQSGAYPRIHHCAVSLWHSMSNFQWTNHKPIPASNPWAVSIVTFLCKIVSETIRSLPLHPISGLCPLWHSHVKFSVKQSGAYPCIQSLGCVQTCNR